MLNSKFHKKQRATEKRIARIEETATEVWRPKNRKLELNDDAIDAKVALRLSNFVVKTPDGARTLIHHRSPGDRGGRARRPAGAERQRQVHAAEPPGALLRSRPGALRWPRPVRYNPATNLVNFDQRMADLPLRMSLRDYICQVKTVNNANAVAILAKAGFPFERLDDRIAKLSYGEQSRLVFLYMKLLKPNFYLLDEPTNHLDIEGLGRPRGPARTVGGLLHLRQP
ncbi:MAG: ATP-binding cassette domain-containing protein [Rhizomicrobium sp.]